MRLSHLLCIILYETLLIHIEICRASSRRQTYVNVHARECQGSTSFVPEHTHFTQSVLLHRDKLRPTRSSQHYHLNSLRECAWMAVGQSIFYSIHYPILFDHLDKIAVLSFGVLACQPIITTSYMIHRCATIILTCGTLIQHFILSLLTT